MCVINVCNQQKVVIWKEKVSAFFILPMHCIHVGSVLFVHSKAIRNNNSTSGTSIRLQYSIRVLGYITTSPVNNCIANQKRHKKNYYFQ